MGTPTTFRDYRLSSAALDKTELMVENGANRIRVTHIYSIRSSGNRRFSPSARWRERRRALGRFARSPSINSVRSIAGEVRRRSCSVFGVQLDIRL
jgi:hypothetical protein